MNALKEKLLKNTSLNFTSSLEESKMFTEKDVITTEVPLINVALSADITGGLVPGITMIAGESKHFKTGFSLLLASAFLKKYSDGIILFYDSEFGTPKSYFDSFSIPHESVIHCPITDIEEFKFDIVKQLKELDRKDHILILVDSIGNLASRKEVEDAENEKSVADLSRAKSLKSLFRIIGPKLTLKDIPLVVVNHVYDEMGLYPKKIVSGGTGPYYNADNIWIIGREQIKEGTEVSGYKFKINIEKSRYVREKTQIPITVSFDGGINRWSGLLDLAVEANFVVKPKVGWYAEVDLETGEVKTPSKRLKDIENDSELWNRLLKTQQFKDYIKNTYKIANGPILKRDDNNS